jgi:hypothetical protein
MTLDIRRDFWRSCSRAGVGGAVRAAVKSVLDRLYGVLDATREQIAQFVVNTQR